MMGELVLNEVEGKEFFYNLNGLFSSFIPNIPAFQYSNCDLPARDLQWQAGRSELN